jgi:hypothetical protein
MNWSSAVPACVFARGPQHLRAARLGKALKPARSAHLGEWASMRGACRGRVAGCWNL